MSRHIPEDELHAYLDQALSRSQCIEIERHLADCGDCRGERDSAAALRDRTTALLSRVSPPARPMVPFEVLANRSTAYATVRLQRRRTALWAASLAGAMATGFISHQVFMDSDGRTAVAIAAPLRTPPRDVATAGPTPAPTTPAPVARDRPAAVIHGAVHKVAPSVLAERRASRSLGFASTPVPNGGMPPADLVQYGNDNPTGYVSFGTLTAGPTGSVSVNGLDGVQRVHTIGSDISGFNEAPAAEQPSFRRQLITDDSVRAAMRRMNRLLHR